MHVGHVLPSNLVYQVNNIYDLYTSFKSKETLKKYITMVQKHHVASSKPNETRILTRITTTNLEHFGAIPSSVPNIRVLEF